MNQFKDITLKRWAVWKKRCEKIDEDKEGGRKMAADVAAKMQPIGER